MQFIQSKKLYSAYNSPKFQHPHIVFSTSLVTWMSQKQTLLLWNIHNTFKKKKKKNSRLSTGPMQMEVT